MRKLIPQISIFRDFLIKNSHTETSSFRMEKYAEKKYIIWID